MSATALVTGFGNSMVRCNASARVGVLWTLKTLSTSLLAALDTSPSSLAALAETPCIPIAPSASAAFLPRRAADSADVPNRVSDSPSPPGTASVMTTPAPTAAFSTLLLADASGVNPHVTNESNSLTAVLKKSPSAWAKLVSADSTLSPRLVFCAESTGRPIPSFSFVLRLLL